MSYNRLDDRTIDDPILLALFHQEVIARATSYSADNISYTIKPDEVYRSDLSAFRPGYVTGCETMRREQWS